MKHVFIFLLGISISIVLVLGQFPKAYQDLEQRTFEERETNLSDSSIVFVGDVLLARDVEMRMNRFGPAYPFTNIANHLTSSIVIANFEASVPEKHVPTPHFDTRFSVDESLLSAMGSAGFTHVSLANNHSYDFGEAGFIHTREALKNAELVPFGDPVQLASTSVTYTELEDVRVAIMGVSFVQAVPNIDALTQIVEEASHLSDMQIAYLHWGIEYEPRHSVQQKQIAYTLIDSGIDAVVGHHPHVVQDIELYNGRPIFYSLGNFIFDQYFSNAVQKGLLLDFSLLDLPHVSVKLIPVSSELSRTSPRALDGYQKEIFLTELASRSASVLHDEIENGTLTFVLK